MLSKNRRNILINTVEQRYIATCYPLKDRPYYEEALKWRERFREYAKMNKTIEIDANEIKLAFPHLARLIIEGFFENRTIQSYFEGVDEKSHNMRNYLFAKSRMREKLPQEILSDILLHVEYCSVRPCDLRNNLVISYSGEREENIDKYYFDGDSLLDANFAFLHGKSENGSVVIREVTKEEFDILAKWFKERQKSRENPFRRIKNYY